MKKIMTCLYVHYYTAVHAPKSWMKYMLFCVGKQRKPDVNLMSRIVMIAEISKSFKKTEQPRTETNTSVNRLIKLHYNCN